MSDWQRVWDTRGSGIIAHPEDDDLRYAFATALEEGESGESPNRARAEFIRIQLKLSSLSPSHAEYTRLATRAYALELRYRRQWIPGLFIEFPEVEFHRGFAELVAVHADILLNRQNQLFAEAPLQHVDILDLDGTQNNNIRQDLKSLLDSLAENGHLQKLVSLGLDGQRLTDESVTILANARFERLRWLSLAYNQIDRRGIDILVRGRFRNLRFLNLQGNLFDPTTELFYDQGIVIERRESQFFSDIDAAEIPWLTKTVRGGQYVQPDRFAVNS